MISSSEAGQGFARLGQGTRESLLIVVGAQEFRFET